MNLIYRLYGNHIGIIPPALIDLLLLEACVWLCLDATFNVLLPWLNYYHAEKLLDAGLLQLFKIERRFLNCDNLLLWTALKGAVSLKIDDTDFSACKKGVQVWLKDAKWRDQEGSTSSQQPCPSQKKSTRRERGLRQNYSSNSEESTSSTKHAATII
ncbi:uncharacterized protein [Temnothorax nylanderi]|uniref:uncharacterized protein isoform X1 n=1 Tax=Temnothorax nylanderi TaxID=102681 RepID=UPI003A877621